MNLLPPAEARTLNVRDAVARVELPTLLRCREPIQSRGEGLSRVEIAAMECLLESFATAALGLELKSQVRHAESASRRQAQRPNHPPKRTSGLRLGRRGRPIGDYWPHA